MRARSKAAAASAGLFAVLAACDRDAREEPVAEAPKTEPAASTPAAADDRSRSGSRGWTPWGRAREAELEAVAAAAEARARVELELELAEREREAAAVERAAAEPPSLAAPATAPAPSLATPAPMSRAEPVPAPMSRPEPELRPLAIPPFAYTLRAEARVAHQGPRPKLELRSVKRNGITDVEAWFRTHALALPTWQLSPTPTWGGSVVGTGDPLPSRVPLELAGHRLSEAIRGVDHDIAIYSETAGRRGSAVVVLDPFGDSLGALEISAWPHDQEIQWAQQQEGVLYLCTYHMGYASTTGGQNAFLTAIELGRGELLWQSEPLVCNSHDFLLRDGWIISGYGFTAEPDSLFVLDMKTGEVVQRKKLASGPEVILEQGGTLYVRTYDRDYEFTLR